MMLDGSEIVEYIPHEELMADKGFYYALYMSEFKGNAPAGANVAGADFTSTWFPLMILVLDKQTTPPFFERSGLQKRAITPSQII